MKIRVPKIVIEKIFKVNIDVPFVRFYFDPHVRTAYVMKNNLFYNVVFGMKNIRNNIEHELTHIKLGHVEKENPGLPHILWNLLLDIEVEYYLRLHGIQSAPQFSDKQIQKYYEKYYEKYRRLLNE